MSVARNRRPSLGGLLPSGLMGKLMLFGGIVFAFVLIAMAGSIWEQVDADEILVIQSPMSGTLTAYTQPGLKFQKFGKVTTYKKRGTYAFSNDIRFNDGGAGKVRGSIQYIMPLGHEQILKLHEQFSSQEAVERDLVEKTTNKSIYMTGPLLSSTESYASRRTDLIRWINDQIENGIYQTTTETLRQMNAITGDSTTITIASIRQGPDGRELRQEAAYLSSFGITTANFAVDAINYDGRVQSQIDEQQQNIMSVQTSMANARRAEQDRITAEQQGLANAASARAEREVEQAKQTTDAETARQVALLDRDAAAAEREANILRGQGEAERKRLVMAADGALDSKLAAWLEAQKAYASAIQGYSGAWVPSVVMGGEGGAGAVAGSGALQLIDMLSVKTARDLALDLTNRGGR